MNPKTLLAVVVSAALWVTAAGTACGQISLYVAGYYGNLDYGSSSVGQFNAQTGAAISPALVSGMNYPRNLVVSGNTLYVTNFVDSSTGQGSVGVFDATTGVPINAGLVPNLYRPAGLALSGNVLFVSFAYSGRIGTYDAASGAPLNASFISGLTLGRPHFITLAGNRLYVSGNTGTVAVFDATTGAAINASLVTGLGGALGVAVAGNSLFVADPTNGTVGQYDAITGAAIRADFLSGLNYPAGLAVSGNTLFVANAANGVGVGSIGAFDVTTGVAINPALVSGVYSPWGIAVASIPEPSSYCLMMALGAVALVVRRRGKRSATGEGDLTGPAGGSPAVGRPEKRPSRVQIRPASFAGCGYSWRVRGPRGRGSA